MHTHIQIYIYIYTHIHRGREIPGGPESSRKPGENASRQKVVGNQNVVGNLEKPTTTKRMRRRRRRTTDDVERQLS